MTKRKKRKKPIHCPVCKKGFSYGAKTAPIGRLSKHIKLKHPRYKRKKSKRKATSKQRIDSDKDKVIAKLLKILLND